MERIVHEDKSLFKSLLPALIVLGVLFSMTVIAYGVESVAPGIHDAFHDVRHTMGCFMLSVYVIGGNNR